MISGKKFLNLNNKESVIITNHALDRIADCMGRPISIQSALKLFEESRQIKYGDLLLMGYRPAFAGRKKKGVMSWYFRLESQESEMIAVISNSQRGDALVWLTTLFENKQTRNFRILNYDDLRLGR